MSGTLDDHQRIVLTGIGLTAPNGNSLPEFRDALLAGRSGVQKYDIRYVGETLAGICDFDELKYQKKKEVRRGTRAGSIGIYCAQEAVADSGLRLDRENPRRIGTIVGAGMGGMVIAEQEYHRVYQNLRPNRVTPNFIPAVTLNSASGVIAIMCGAKGPNLTISTACSSSAHAIGLARAAIRSGQADVVIVAGADASIVPLTFAGFCSLRALSTSFNDTPERASRPFSQTRDGFVMGEGAGVLILESLAHARKRRARIYAEVSGYAATSEAYHMVIPREDGLDISSTMAMALRDAGVQPAQVDYINAHATSTPIGDVVEIKAIKRLFKSRATRISINATKSLVGHTMGAAGALAGIICAMTLSTGQIHPTINYDDPDPDCALPGISTQAQERPVKVALLNAFGFGSNNAAVVLEKFLP